MCCSDSLVGKLGVVLARSRDINIGFAQLSLDAHCELSSLLADNVEMPGDVISIGAGSDMLPLLPSLVIGISHHGPIRISSDLIDDFSFVGMRDIIRLVHSFLLSLRRLHDFEPWLVVTSNLVGILVEICSWARDGVFIFLR